MKRCLQKCRKILTFLLAVLLVYDGVMDATLLAAAENGSTDGQVMAAEEEGLAASAGEEGSVASLGAEDQSLPTGEENQAASAGEENQAVSDELAVASEGDADGQAASETGSTEAQTVPVENGGAEDQTAPEENGSAEAQTASVENGGAEGQTVPVENDVAEGQAVPVENNAAEAQTAPVENNVAEAQTAPVENNAAEAQTAPVENDVAGQKVAEEVFETYVPDVELPDNDELFAGYVEQLFYGEFNSGISLFGNVGEQLTGNEKILYDTLKNAIREIAAGTRSSTKDIVVEGFSDFAVGDAGTITNKVLAYLLMDCPYDFYWYNKTNQGGMSTSSSYNSTSGIVTKVTVSFAVAAEYQGVDTNTVDSSKVNIAKDAAAKAQEIVAKYQGKSDYEKLDGYRQEICDLVEYNTPAAVDSSTAYGNPWQLIWVFDGDASTNVVCEGYSKAFQYLCDLSTFSDAVCYTVTGEMSGGTGAGGHMWNIVTIEGKNYLVDVTNCDTGSVGAPKKLFLAGTDGSVETGYLFQFDSLNQVKFTYGSDQQGLLGTVLELESENYSPKTTYPLTVTAPQGVNVVFGNEVSKDVLNTNVTTVGSATAMVGDTQVTVAGTFEWAASVKSYGEAGTKELAAVFVPDDKDKYGASHAVTVTVTVARRPVSISVNAQTKVYGQDDPKLPELTYVSGQTIEDYPLNGKLEREKGENVGTYKIILGSLNDENNPNYTITISNADTAVLTITPAECTREVTTPQTVLQGVGKIVEPKFKGVKEEELTGTLSYSYGDLKNGTYEQLTEKLKELSLGAEGEITYSFVPDSDNYKIETSPGITGTISFTVKDIEFVAGTGPAIIGNGVTVKETPVYGDTWADIVQITGITAQAGSGTDSDASHFTLSETGMPEAGDIPFKVLYNGSLNGKTYTDVEVCSGTVNVEKGSITVAAGDYRVSKVYDKTTDPGTASGALEVYGILAKDTGVSVTASPVAYTNANVGAQARMTLPLTLSGTGADNYTLANTEIVVPCEITPMTITPVVEITGTYQYTGSEITPELTVKNGSEVMTADIDYKVDLSDNINAGTAKVTVKPETGKNYTWSAVEGSFVISKAEYPYERTATTGISYGNTAVYNLVNLLRQEGYQMGAIAVTDEDGILEGTPSISGTQLSYKLAYDKAKVGKTAVITVPVETLNYEEFDLVITVSVYDKLAQTDFAFQDAALGRTYGDADFMATVINAVSGSSFTFTSSNPAVATVDNNGLVHILKTGDTVITVNASETADYMAASATCTLTVAPKALAWDVNELSAADRKDAVQNGSASLYGELKAAGILESDNGEVIFHCPAEMLTGTYANVAVGVQDVALAWKDSGNPATLQGAKAENYVLPSDLPSITGKINEVTRVMASIPESTPIQNFSITLEGGISSVPEAFKNLENLNTPKKLETQMTKNVQTVTTVQGETVVIPGNSIAVYDVILMVSINGGEWQPASKDNFPATGVTVTLPYPTGTGQDSHDFVVCHLFTEDINGYHVEQEEYPIVTKTPDGISFKVHGLSPISVGWRAAGTLGNEKAGGDDEEEDEEDIVETPAADSQVKSPKTEDRSFRVWPYAAVILSIDLAVYAWERRRSRAAGSGRKNH